MKKTITIAAILVSVFAFSQTGKIALSGGFGGVRCNGSVGLCNVSQNSVNKNISETKFYAEKIDETAFRMVVNRGKMSKNEELQITGKEFVVARATENKDFTVEEDYVLDSKTADAIGLKSGFVVIPKGKYPITFDDENIVITFICRQ
jgi:hypothetical protein